MAKKKRIQTNNNSFSLELSPFGDIDINSMALPSKPIINSDSKEAIELKPKIKKNQTVYIKREKSGRAGKIVTIIEGLNLDENELKAKLKELKSFCGSGGTLKDNLIEIQGDQRKKLSEYFTTEGYRVKLSGG